MRVCDTDGPAIDIKLEVYEPWSPMLVMTQVERDRNPEGYYDEAPERIVSEIEVTLDHNQIKRLISVLEAAVKNEGAKYE